MKLKLSLADAFRDRKFKYSGTATVLVIAVVVATLIVNLACSMIPFRLDVTANKYFSITDKTMSVLNRLDKDIDIYFLYQAGAEDGDVMELASRYAMASNHIKTQQIDPIANPGFVDDFLLDEDKSSTTPQSGNVIVQCKDTGKFATLTNDDFYSYTTDESSGVVTAVYFLAEQAFTSAIAAVTSEKEYNIALLTGHNEASLPTEMQTVLEKMFFNIYTVDLQVEKAIPAKTDVLVILAPEYDILQSEYDIIKEYLNVSDRAGDAIFVMGNATTPTPNFNKLMEYYNLKVYNYSYNSDDSNYGKNDLVIYEEDTTKYAAGIKYSLLLPFNNTDATALAGVSQKLYLQNARPIQPGDLQKASIVLDPIVRTSKSAWASSKDKSGTWEKEPGDLVTETGFVPMMAVTEYGNNEGTSYSRIFVVNCANFMLESQAMLNAYANDEVFYSALYWCLDAQESMVTITPKHYLTATHTLSTFGIYTYGIVLGLILPIAVLGFGLVVYLKRRHL